MIDDIWKMQPERIGVFRALQLGDLLCAVPAFRALRAKAPHAHITLIGLPCAKAFAKRFHHYVDDFLEFPGFPGFVEREGTLNDLAQFLLRTRKHPFDLAFQLHGSGEMTNGIVALIGAQQYAGFYPTNQPWEKQHNFFPWPEHGHEIHRWLHMMELAGVSSEGDYLEFPIDRVEQESWATIAAAHGLQAKRYICIHPGARLPSRRWPVARFAEVAQALSVDGWKIVITGAAEEADITRSLMLLLRANAIDLTGKTNVGELAALIANACMLVCNDTGVSHVAAAVRTPSVVIFPDADVARWAPLDGGLHSILWHESATGVYVSSVIVEARRVLYQFRARGESIPDNPVVVSRPYRFNAASIADQICLSVDGAL